MVYVGTAVGVWRGALTITAGVPAWDWAALANGLPEAAVQDLSVVRYPLAQGGRVRLLRAALQSRGAWECQLDADLVDVTYLRVHPYDTRRSLPTALTDPLPPPRGADREWHLDWADVRARAFRDAAGRPAPSPDGTPAGSFTWHASPDLRVRPAPGSPAFPAPASLPWTRKPADKYALWALQTALHAVDPLIVPDGRWTALFGRRLRALRRANGLSDIAVVDAALWNHAAIAAGWWADPWDGPAPSEADLVERIVHRTTARPVVGTEPEVDAPTVSAASCAVPAGPLAVEVCVHRRALQPLGPDGLTVLLLRTQLDPNAANWAGMPALAVAGLGDAMAGVPADGGPLGLHAAGRLAARRRQRPGPPPVARRAGRPGRLGAAPVVVSFRTDLPGRSWPVAAAGRDRGRSRDAEPGGGVAVRADPRQPAPCGPFGRDPLRERGKGPHDERRREPAPPDLAAGPVLGRGAPRRRGRRPGRRDRDPPGLDRGTDRPRPGRGQRLRRVGRHAGLGPGRGRPRRRGPVHPLRAAPGPRVSAAERGQLLTSDAAASFSAFRPRGYPDRPS